MIAYKGYQAEVTFDAEAGIFHGEVVNLRDVITFQGATREEAEAAMAASVEDYLAFCAARDDPRVTRGSGDVFADLGFDDPAAERALARQRRGNIARLRQLCAEGEASGPAVPVDFDELLEEARQQLNAARADSR